MTRRLLTILTTLLATYGVAQAQEQTETQTQQDGQQQQQAQQEPRAAVRFAHLGSGGPTLQIDIDGQDRGQVEAETVTDYVLLPAGNQQIEITRAQAQQQGQGQDGQGQDAQGQQVQPGQVPQEVRQAVQNAQQAVQQGQQQENQEGQGQDPQQAIEDALSQVEDAIQNASAEALPTLEAVQASLAEAQEALQNDERQVAQEALDNAVQLIEDAQAAAQQQAQGQDGQGQQNQALFSESVNLEAGNYYTILASAQQSGQIARVGQDGAQPEGQQEDEQEAELDLDDEQDQEGDQGQQQNQDPQNQSQQNQQQEGQQGQNQIEIRVVQDSLSVPPAGSALVRIVHASADAPALNFVVAPSGQQNQQQSQNQQNQDQQNQNQQNQEGEQNQEGQQNQSQQNQQQEGQQQQNQQQGQGSLDVTIQPAQARSATVNVTGPDGFEQTFSGERTLSDLLPGTYVVTGTLTAYQPAATQTEVQAGGTAQAQLSFQRLASAGPPPIEGRTVVDDVAFGSASGYQPIPAASYTAQLRAVDQDLTALELRGLELQPGAAYTIFTYGQLRDDSFSATITVDVLVPQGQQGQQQEGQQQEGQQQQNQQQEGQQGQEGDVQQTLQSVRDMVQSAIDQLAEGNVDAATQPLQQAQDELAAAIDSASGDVQQALQQAQQGIEEARSSLEEGDAESARSTLEDVQQQLSELTGQGQ